MFFDGGTIGCYANARGGIKAAIIIPFCTGIITILGSAVAASLFGLYSYGGWQGNFDFDTLWLAIGYFAGVAKVPAIIIVIVLMLLIPQIQYARTKDKSKYFITDVMQV